MGLNTVALGGEEHVREEQIGWNYIKFVWAHLFTVTFSCPTSALTQRHHKNNRSAGTAIASGFITFTITKITHLIIDSHFFYRKPIFIYEPHTVEFIPKVFFSKFVFLLIIDIIHVDMQYKDKIWYHLEYSKYART